MAHERADADERESALGNLYREIASLEETALKAQAREQGRAVEAAAERQELGDKFPAVRG
ncbi:hypothetical protein [Plantactinospora soyae]|uniref:Uncharacterized protein n=1 Tax=Plantactinospora soyae TaxID=1544732 RepID=A0A927M2G6_9ACTN|nr:hypothetical protein [Plantactinospora soyae]MBE1485615.1 hypothetical protein [Plantactinospora soyae]